MDESEVIHAMALDDSYAVVRVLGDSPTGRTELVTLDGTGPFVRKRIPRELANPDAWAQAMRVEHPLIPKVHSIYETPDELCVVSDYIEGRSLAEAIGQLGSIPVKLAARISCDVCEAASALHAVGIVHRDITPSNIILTDGHAHLIDLGIARRYEAGASSDTTHLGTYGFAAPEQFGFAQTDARSDVYSIGAILGYMITGAKPTDPMFFSELELSAPTEIIAVIKRATAFEPSERFQSAAELEGMLKGTLLSPRVVAEEHQVLQNAQLDGIGTQRIPDGGVKILNGRSGTAPASANAAAPQQQERDSHVQSAQSRISSALFGWIPRFFPEFFNGARLLLENISACFQGNGNWGAAIITILGVLIAVRFAIEIPQQRSYVNQGWDYSFALYGVECGVFLMYGIAQEISLKLLKAGPYANRERNERLAVRIAHLFAIWLAIAFVIVLLASALFGNSTERPL